jgi:hypothetical protein
MTSSAHANESKFAQVRALLPEWQISLKARGGRPGTIARYVTVANRFNAFLVAEGAPTKVSALTHEHVEGYLAELFDRTAPATVAKHYRSLQ